MDADVKCYTHTHYIHFVAGIVLTQPDTIMIGAESHISLRISQSDLDEHIVLPLLKCLMHEAFYMSKTRPPRQLSSETAGLISGLALLFLCQQRWF